MVLSTYYSSITMQRLTQLLDLTTDEVRLLKVEGGGKGGKMAVLSLAWEWLQSCVRRGESGVLVPQPPLPFPVCELSW